MSMIEQSTVIGVFRDRSLADAAIRELHQAGFTDEQVHLLGHSGGNVLEGLKNLFSSKQTTTATDTTDELAQVGVRQDTITYYQQEIESGNYVVAVQPSSGQQRQAREILYQHGAYDASTDEGRIGGGGRVVPVREEQFHIDKHFVQTGEVVIHKRVITENKTFTIPVMREEVTIERLPVQGQGNTTNPQTPPDNASFERRENSDATNAPVTNGHEAVNNSDTIRVLVREEQVLFTKQPVVIEEIIVRKQRVQENREVSGELRREEVHVEHSGNIIIHDAGADTNS